MSINIISEPATEKQINAITNMGEGFGIPFNIPKTKSEASAEFNRLKQEIDYRKFAEECAARDDYDNGFDYEDVYGGL